MAAASILLIFACDKAPNGTPTQAPAAAESAEPTSGDAGPAPSQAMAKAPLRLAGEVVLSGGITLPFFAVIAPEKGETAGYGGTIDIPAQSVRGARLHDVSLAPDRRVAFSLAVPGTAKWVGKFAGDGTIACTFTQGGASVPCSMAVVSEQEFAAVSASAAPRRPQTPQGPFPYSAREVTYRNDKAGIQIAGTLTVPEGRGPHPAVLLITGSGAQDRDETIFEHKPFWVLADSLTRAGVAVLRTDDRGVGGTGEGAPGATSADYADDVRAGLAFLRTQPEIDARHLGLLGHSEGGLIAPMVAADNKDVGFIVLLAGPGVPGDDVLAMQVRRMAISGGASSDDAKQLGADQRAVMTIILEEDDAVARKAKVAAALRRQAKRDGAPSPTDAQVEASMATIGSPWFRFFLATDPAQSLRRVHCPVLAVNGELDVQVDAEQNLPAIRRALAKAGNQKVTIERRPHLNHLFQRAKTGAVREYAEIEQTFDPATLELVTDWVVQAAR